MSIDNLPVPDYIRALAPYVGGKPISEVARKFGLDESRIVKLASNENPLGVPDSAKKAMMAAVAGLARYPDSNGHDLKQALSRRLGLPMDWITLGNGSNDLLVLAGMAFLRAGAAAVYSQYSFVVYALATQEVGARSIVVPATAGLGHDLDAMLAAIDADTQLVFIANPNNPTGTFLPRERIDEFLSRVPEHVVVLLDQAYDEYLPPDLRADASDWVRRFPNVIVTRTFSKAYGLAGLRVGYAIAQPAITDVLNRIRQPFNVSTLAQAAAVAALDDDAFIARSVELNRAGYGQLTQAFDELKLGYLPSYGNFVLVDVGDGEAVSRALLERGVIVRPVANYDLPEYLRVSIGREAENAAFIAALREALPA